MMCIVHVGSHKRRRGPAVLTTAFLSTVSHCLLTLSVSKFLILRSAFVRVVCSIQPCLTWRRRHVLCVLCVSCDPSFLSTIISYYLLLRTKSQIEQPNFRPNISPWLVGFRQSQKQWCTSPLNNRVHHVIKKVWGLYLHCKKLGRKYERERRSEISILSSVDT